MFGLLKKKPQNILFLINLHIGRGTNKDMPANLVGAFVPAFVAASDHELAAQRAVSALTEEGYEFLDISDKKIHQLDPLKWDSYVKEAWPEFEAHLPRQNDVLTKLQGNLLFFGPFSGYESQNA